MKSPHSTPFYFISKKNPLIEKHWPSIAVTIGSGRGGLLFQATPHVVNLLDVTGPQNIVLALHHFPQYIEQMLFTLRFAFRPQEDVEQLMPELQWKVQPKYHRWFNSMRSLPMLPFFVHDREVRLLILAGDYTLHDTWAAIRHPGADPNGRIVIRGGAIKELSKRLKESCYQLMLFCHGSGYNPKQAIETVLAQYSLPVHYADIYNAFQKDLRNHSGSWRSMDAGAAHQPV